LKVLRVKKFEVKVFFSYVLSDADGGNVREHAQMAGVPESRGVKNPESIHEHDLWMKPNVL
jgi:hypothetical protein